MLATINFTPYSLLPSHSHSHTHTHTHTHTGVDFTDVVVSVRDIKVKLRIWYATYMYIHKVHVAGS